MLITGPFAELFEKLGGYGDTLKFINFTSYMKFEKYITRGMLRGRLLSYIEIYNNK